MAKTTTPKLTAQQRRFQKEAESAAKAEAFEKNRAAVWLALWAKALRLALLVKDMPEPFRVHNSWWLEDFLVDAKEEYFTVNATMSVQITQTHLSVDDVESIDSDLDRGLSLLDEFNAEEERKRQAALELKRKREVALAKLSDEDKVVLNLR